MTAGYWVVSIAHAVCVVESFAMGRQSNTAFFKLWIGHVCTPLYETNSVFTMRRLFTAVLHYNYSRDRPAQVRLSSKNNMLLEPISRGYDAIAHRTSFPVSARKRYNSESVQTVQAVSVLWMSWTEGLIPCYTKLRHLSVVVQICPLCHNIWVTNDSYCNHT